MCNSAASSVPPALPKSVKNNSMGMSSVLEGRSAICSQNRYHIWQGGRYLYCVLISVDLKELVTVHFSKTYFIKTLLALIDLVHFWECDSNIFLDCSASWSELEELAWCFLGMRKVYEEVWSARKLLSSSSIEEVWKYYNIFKTI